MPLRSEYGPYDHAHLLFLCRRRCVDDADVAALHPAARDDAVFLTRAVPESTLPRVAVDDHGIVAGTSDVGGILTYNLWASTDLLRYWLALCLGPPAVPLVHHLDHIRSRASAASGRRLVDARSQHRRATALGRESATRSGGVTKC